MKTPIERGRPAALLLCLLVLGGMGLPQAWAQPREAVAPQNGQEIYRWGSVEHETLLWLAVEAGHALPSGTGPFSGAELLVELSRIDPDRLSAAGLRRRAWLREQLSGAGAAARAEVVEDGLLFSAGLEVNLEGYLDTNAAVEHWEYRPRQRLPFLSIPLEAWVGHNGYAIIDLDFRKYPPRLQEKRRDGTRVDAPTIEPNPRHNVVIGSHKTIDIEFPSRAFISVGGDHWNLQFGRDDLRWGNGHTGSLYLGDSVREYDFARLSAFWRVFKFTTVWISMDGGLSPAEEADKLADAQSKYHKITDPHRSFLAHRFEVRLWNRINLVATEGLMYGGRAMDLRYLNPMMLYHNHYTNSFPGNVHMSYEIEGTIVPGLAVYAHLSPDQWSSPLEPDQYTDNEPNAVSYLAGVRWQANAGTGFVRTIFEATFLDPWMYIHDRGHTSLTYRRNLTTEHFLTARDRVFIEEPLGYYTGNDSAVLFLESRYVEPGNWFAGARGRMEVHGERRITDTLPTGVNEPNMTPALLNAVTPSGPHPEWRTAATLFGEVQPGITGRIWAATPRAGRGMPELTVGGEVSWLTVLNRGNVAREREHDVQAVLYTRLRWR